MATDASRRARERYLRRKYRKKVWTVGIVVLIIGLIIGFVGGCIVADRWLLNNDEVQTFPTEVTPTPAAIVEAPTVAPTAVPTEEPTAVPTEEPTAVPTEEPTAVPTEEPTAVPTEEPTAVPTEEPTAEPTAEPTEEPTAVPTEEPTAVPTEEPTAEPVISLQINEPAQAGVAVSATDVPATEAPATEAPTEQPTAVPTAEPTAEPVVAPEPVIVPYGESLTFETQIRADGNARLYADDAEYETISFTLDVSEHKDPAYFRNYYSDTFNLTGTEAAVEFALTLNNYEGTATIIPQNIILITMRGDDDSVTSQGYQLMDAEMAGNIGITLTSDKATTLFKRYPWNAEQGDMKYMVVNAYIDGITQTYWFELFPPAPVVTEAPVYNLTIGSSGDDVAKLQQKLIDLGLLFGVPDGKYGNYTAQAVMEMQRRFGMAQTGVADTEFLMKLFS